MKRTLLVIFVLVLMAPASVAQLWKLKRIEFTGGLGTATFFGDVGGYSHGKNALGLKDFTFLQTRYSLSFSTKYRITQNLNARLGISYALLHATDQRGSNERRLYETDTRILEPALICEYYFVKNSAENSYLFNKGRGGGFIGFLNSLDFYAFTGFAGVSYKITPNQKLENHGLVTDGFTAAVPLGVGGVFAAYPDINFGIEIGFRYALTDNLDGYTSQYSSANDVYYFLNLTVTYRLKLKRRVMSSFRR
jgi:opacity protein-like surface antigen